MHTHNIPTPQTALAVGAHPDDIEFGAGATLAKWAADGCVVSFLVCTDGSKGTWDPSADIKNLIASRKLEQLEAAKKIPLILAPYTSLGITLLKEMLSSIKNHLVSHKIEIIEKHQKDKKDLPSGTSKDIAKYIENSLLDRKILIESLREDNSAGEHSVSLIKDNEVLTISHKVTNRSVYSEGALLAAVWLDKKRGSSGLYQMSDIYVPFEED